MRSALRLPPAEVLDAARWAQDRAERGGLPGFRGRQLADRLQADLEGTEILLRRLSRSGLVREIRTAGASVYRVPGRAR